MPKYKDYVLRMINENKQVFDEFRTLHDRYALDVDNLQAEFNQKGEIIREIIREYENRLCANTERGSFVRYSAKLSEKFYEEIRKLFPMIDHIGLVVQKKQEDKQENAFNLRKINLPTS